MPGRHPHVFFYNNIQLMPSFTFKWFGIEDGSHIYVREAKRNGKDKSNKDGQKKKKSKNVSRTKNGLSLERAKMKDQFFTKVEGTVFCYRNIIRRFMNTSSLSELPNAPQIRTVVQSEQLDKPATEQLPRFWSDHEDNDPAVQDSPFTD